MDRGLRANGHYKVSVNAGQVADVAGDKVAAASATFQVNIPVAGSNPTTTLAPLVNVTTPGGTTNSVSVTYAATDAIARVHDYYRRTCGDRAGRTLTVTG